MLILNLISDSEELYDCGLFRSSEMAVSHFIFTVSQWKQVRTVIILEDCCSMKKGFLSENSVHSYKTIVPKIPRKKLWPFSVFSLFKTVNHLVLKIDYGCLFSWIKKLSNMCLHSSVLWGGGSVYHQRVVCMKGNFASTAQPSPVFKTVIVFSL